MPQKSHQIDHTISGQTVPISLPHPGSVVESVYEVSGGTRAFVSLGQAPRVAYSLDKKAEGFIQCFSNLNWLSFDSNVSKQRKDSIFY